MVKAKKKTKVHQIFIQTTYHSRCHKQQKVCERCGMRHDRERACCYGFCVVMVRNKCAGCVRPCARLFCGRIQSFLLVDVNVVVKGDNAVNSLHGFFEPGRNPILALVPDETFAALLHGEFVGVHTVFTGVVGGFDLVGGFNGGVGLSGFGLGHLSTPDYWWDM